MLLLAIVSSTPQASVALGGPGCVLARASLGRPHAHAEFLAPAIRFCAEQARVELDQLCGVAVDCGPGLFTGLRVGIATAKAVSLTLGIPIVSFPSLDLLAFGARFTRREIWPAGDARRDVVSTARYRPTPGGVERVSEYEVCSPETLAWDLAAHGRDVLVVGDGGLVHSDVFAHVEGAVLADTTYAHPSAAAARELAAARFGQEDFGRPADVAPMYLRRSEAEIKWDERRAGAGGGGT